MVNPHVTHGIDPAAGHPERALALAYAPAEARDGLTALLTLDAVMAGIVRTTREPIVGQMRLTWWAEALGSLDNAPPASHPVLTELVRSVLPRGVTGADLATMADGWEVLLGTEPLDPVAIGRYAQRRGAVLFAAAGRVLGAGPTDPVASAGEGWALADLALNVRHEALAATVRAAAVPPLAHAIGRRWSRGGRPLGALVVSARADLAGNGAPGSPRRVARLLLHRLTGR